jgi:hypothetical protein
MTLAAQRARPEGQPGPHMFAKAGASKTGIIPNCGSDIIHTENPRLSYVNPMIVEKMSSRLRAQTAECVMDTLGISVNTWLKMRKGMPIRKSVAERLLQRVGPNL